MSRSPLRGLIRAALCTLVLLAGSAPAWCRQPQPVQHEFRIRHFKTEGGVELPEVRIVYGTYGHLDAAGDNALLLPSLAGRREVHQRPRFAVSDVGRIQHEPAEEPRFHAIERELKFPD